MNKSKIHAISQNQRDENSTNSQTILLPGDLVDSYFCLWFLKDAGNVNQKNEIADVWLIAFLWFVLPGVTFWVTSYILLSWNKQNLLQNTS